MKAYELTAKVTADGQIELPDFRLSPTSSPPATVKVIVLVSEPDENPTELGDSPEEFSEVSFKRSWEQAIAGDTVPLSQLWEETDNVWVYTHWHQSHEWIPTQG